MLVLLELRPVVIGKELCAHDINVDNKLVLGQKDA